LCRQIVGRNGQRFAILGDRFRAPALSKKSAAQVGVRISTLRQQFEHLVVVPDGLVHLALLQQHVREIVLRLNVIG